MRSLLLALGLSAVVATAASAATVTADFEGLTTFGFDAPSVVSQGYTFAASDGSNLAVIARGTACSPVCADDGTSTLIFGTPNIIPDSIAPLVITGPSDFQLEAFDYAEISPAPGANAVTLQVVGVLADGSGTVERTLIVGPADGPGGNPDFTHETFDAAFANSVFSQVDITGRINSDRTGAFSLDNVTLSTGGGVPEPASWALMIAGFGLAGATLRRRRAILA
jgi:PEP-CTERM motif